MHVALLLAALVSGAEPLFAQTKSSEPEKPAEVSADVAFGAFQRGQYLTAYAEATRRIEQHKDPKAMTLVGELLAHGLGVKRDEARAVHR
jgi:TPR repeat protein